MTKKFCHWHRAVNQDACVFLWDLLKDKDWQQSISIRLPIPKWHSLYPWRIHWSKRCQSSNCKMYWNHFFIRHYGLTASIIVDYAVKLQRWKYHQKPTSQCLKDCNVKSLMPVDFTYQECFKAFSISFTLFLCIRKAFNRSLRKRQDRQRSL